MSRLSVRVAYVGDAAAGVRWRLVAGNGRSVAASAQGYADESAARDALAELVPVAGALVPQFTHPRSSVSWEWSAVGPVGVTVATGERTYGRFGTCSAAFARFVSVLTRLPAGPVGAADG